MIKFEDFLRLINKLMKLKAKQEIQFLMENQIFFMILYPGLQLAG